MDPLALVPLARTLVDIDSTTGREGDAAAGSPPTCVTCAGTSKSSPSRAIAFNVIATLDRRGCVLHALRLRAAVFPEPRRGRRPVRPRRLRRQGHARRAGRRPPSGCARAGERAWACCSSWVRSGAATARRRPTSIRSRRLPISRQRRADGQPLGTAHRGVLRVRLTATGRAAHSSLPEMGESAIDKLIDALIALRAQPLPEDAVARPHALHRRADLRRRRAERRVAARRGRSDVPHASARSRICGRRSTPLDAARQPSRPCSKCRRCG